MCTCCMSKFIKVPAPPLLKMTDLLLKEGVKGLYDKVDGTGGNMIKKLQHFNTTHCRTLNEETQMIKGMKPEKVFASYQKDFIMKSLVSTESNKALKNRIKVMPYQVTEEDNQFSLIDLPKGPEHTNTFMIRRKEYQVVQKQNS